MSFQNPTPITVGTNGTFAGRQYRVAGRVVMGMEEAGETYYWNEFNLVGADGTSATLVCEETERGAEWRLFTLFEPRNPMSVQEAAAKRVGDPVTLDNRLRSVTLVDESRVYHIEGEAPEGVEVGDVARYFNAGAGDGMIVVSWTGEEIEFYRGMDLPRAAVAVAFGLPGEPFGRGLRSPTPTAVSAGWVPKLVGFFLATTILFAAYSSCRPRRQQATPVKPKTPPAPLSIGDAGQLNGTSCRIRGYTLVEVAQVGLLYDRHEYDLDDEAGNRRLLVCDSKAGKANWLLFAAFQPATPLSPHQAAAKRLGEQVDLDGTPARVTDLFRATIRQAHSLELSAQTNGTVLYGFGAQSGTSQFLARWNESGTTLYRGRTLPARDVTAAFAQRKAK